MKTTILALFCLAVAGCGMFNPSTRVSYGQFGFSLENSKDVTIKVKKASYNAESHEFDVEDLEFLDDASAVRRANVEQITAINEQIKIHGENIQASLALITGLAEKVIPGFQVQRAATDGGDSGALLRMLLSAAKQQLKAETQPAK